MNNNEFIAQITQDGYNSGYNNENIQNYVVNKIVTSSELNSPEKNRLIKQYYNNNNNDNELIRKITPIIHNPIRYNSKVENNDIDNSNKQYYPSTNRNKLIAEITQKGYNSGVENKNIKNYVIGEIINSKDLSNKNKNRIIKDYYYNKLRNNTSSIKVKATSPIKTTKFKTDTFKTNTNEDIRKLFRSIIKKAHNKHIYNLDGVTNYLFDYFKNKGVNNQNIERIINTYIRNINIPKQSTKINTPIVHSNTWSNVLKNAFRITEQGGGGDCFFFSVGKALDIDPARIRQQIAVHVNDNLVNRFIRYLKVERNQGDFNAYTEYYQDLIFEGLVFSIRSNSTTLNNLIRDAGSMYLLKKRLLLLTLEDNKVHLKSMVANMATRDEFSINLRYRGHNITFICSYWGNQWAIHVLKHIYENIRILNLNIRDLSIPTIGEYSQENLSERPFNILLSYTGGHYQLYQRIRDGAYLIRTSELPDIILQEFRRHYPLRAF
jgi:hypothetical protein